MRLLPGPESPIGQALAGSPSQPMKVIAITGSHGKTATSCLLASVLHAAGHAVGVVGSLGCLDGREVTHPAQTPPRADELASLLARMAGHGCSHAILEVHGEALDDRRVAGVEFDAACVTCVRADPPEQRDATGGRQPAEFRLLGQLAGEGLAVLNADDPASADFLGRIDGPALTVGLRTPAEITASIVEQSPSEQTFLLVAGSEIVPVATRRIGRHHVTNCLLAAAVGLAYGVDLPTVVRGLEAVDHVPGRLERIECGQPFGVFVDHARSPEGLAACLATLREVVSGRLICVFGAEGDLDPPERRRLGQAAEDGADLAVVTCARRNEDRLAAIDDILRGFRRPEDAAVVPERAEAIALALGRARPGDAVLVLGDEADFVRAWLYSGGARPARMKSSPICGSFRSP